MIAQTPGGPVVVGDRVVLMVAGYGGEVTEIPEATTVKVKLDRDDEVWTVPSDEVYPIIATIELDES